MQKQVHCSVRPGMNARAGKLRRINPASSHNRAGFQAREERMKENSLELD